MRNQYNVQFVLSLTPVVKRLMIINTAVWFLLVIVGEQLIGHGFFSRNFGLVPANLVERFFVWQIGSYMFLHAPDISHILFNMLILWFVGSDLETRWGSRFFFIYYMVCGIGAAIIYAIGITIYHLLLGPTLAWVTPVVGASGAIFGLLLAYGIIFSDRTVYFAMIFPMPAKYFVMLLGAIEFVTLINSRSGGETGVANLAHLGGIVAGYLFLFFWSRWSSRRRNNDPRTTNRRNLKLVVNNEANEKQGPKFWN